MFDVFVVRGAEVHAVDAVEKGQFVRHSKFLDSLVHIVEHVENKHISFFEFRTDPCILDNAFS